MYSNIKPINFSLNYSSRNHALIYISPQIIDANNPADVIESFTVEDKHILCVASVPGAVAADYRDQDEANTNTGDDQSTPLAVCH